MVSTELSFNLNACFSNYKPKQATLIIQETQVYSYQNNIVRIFSAEVLKLILGETCMKATLKCKAVISSQKPCIDLYLEQQSRTMHMSERAGHKFVGRGSTILHMHSWQAPLNLDLEKFANMFLSEWRKYTEQQQKPLPTASR